MMAASETGGGHALARLVVALAVVLLLLGAVWYGASSEALQRMWLDLTGRPSGPMSFRFFLQPAMAAIAATHDGIRDAQLGRSPYFWTVLSNPAERSGRLREGLTSTARIILLGLGMDAIYQLKVFGTFYPAEALVMALALACIPYFLIRGPVDRIARWWLGGQSQGGQP